MASFALTFSLPIEAVRNLSHMGAATPFKLSLPGVIGTFMMVFPIAVMISAVLLAISLFAKSFKEAQSYVSPLMILVILPAVAVMLPGIELNWRLAMIPILNVSLVCKELLTGSFPWVWIGFVFGSTCIYSAVALGFAVAMFKRESVLFRA
jgi:sodium transport system permease protein